MSGRARSVRRTIHASASVARVTALTVNFTIRFLWLFPGRFLASANLPAIRLYWQEETVWFPVLFPFVSCMHTGDVSKETSLMPVRSAHSPVHPFLANQRQMPWLPAWTPAPW